MASAEKSRIGIGGFAWPASTVIVCGTLGLFLISWIVEPQSTSHGAINGMLPFAARAGDRRGRPDPGDPAGRHRPLGAGDDLADGRDHDPPPRRGLRQAARQAILLGTGARSSPA